MKIDTIKDGDIIIANIIRSGEWPEGLKFYTDDKDFVQVSTWNYNAGKHLKAHSHKVCVRNSNRTQEVVMVKNGKMKADFYNREGKLIKEDCLNKGDIAIIYAGGHAYDILEDKTLIFEVKNGPYPGIEKDKELIEE